MAKLINITGETFSKLRVISYFGNCKWFAQCDCGNSILADASALRSGRTHSCGCEKRKILRERNTTHGRTKTTEYKSWSGMKQRCCYVKHKSFHRYGGRGIKVCAEWENSFERFLQDMGRKPSRRHFLERRDNDGDYCKDNCFWGTPAQQSRNKSANKWVEFEGRKMCVTDWASHFGIPVSTLSKNLKRLPFKEAVERLRSI